ncbi:MAG: hypothetical protein WDZ40_02840 [Candidatus Spechtbacterales bacterium]
MDKINIFFKYLKIGSRKPEDSQGFSLMELIVYTALLAMVIMFLFQFLLGAVNSQSRGGSKDKLINNTISAMHAIDFQIRHSSDIYDATSDFVSDPGQLSLLSKKAGYPGETQAYLDIFVDSNERLCIKKENTGIQCLTSGGIVVASLDFSKVYLEDGTEDGILTALTLEYNPGGSGDILSHSVQSFTQMRNY